MEGSFLFKITINSDFIMELSFTLNSQRLLLRPFKKVDVTAFLEAIHESMINLTTWLEWCHPDYTEQEAHDWIITSQLSWQHNYSYELAIFSQNTDDFIGTISLNNLDPIFNCANIGYWIRDSQQQQGFAKEAVNAITDFAFSTLNLTRLEIVTHTNNLASQHTALTCGAQLECLARHKLYLFHQAQDAFVYSLLPSDVINR